MIQYNNLEPTGFSSLQKLSNTRIELAGGAKLYVLLASLARI